MNTAKTSSLHEVTRIIPHGYKHFDEEKFRKVFDVFCSTHDIKKPKLKISCLSHQRGSWSYSFKVKCSKTLCNDLITELNKALEEMGIPLVAYQKL